MRNIILFVLSVFADNDEWTDLTYDLNEAYQHILNKDDVYEFVEAKLISDFWAELDCKSSDIVDIKYFMFDNGDFMYSEGYAEKNTFCTAGLDGIYEFFMEKTCFNLFFMENNFRRKLYRNTCIDVVKKYGLPTKIFNAVKKF